MMRRAYFAAYLISFFFSFASVAQEDRPVMAVSEDINQFDRLLSKQPLPPGADRVLQQLQKRDEQGLPFQHVSAEDQQRPLGASRPNQRIDLREKGMRENFEGRDPNRFRVAQPPIGFRQDQLRQPLGPDREQGRRRQDGVSPDGRRRPPPQKRSSLKL